VRRTPHRTSSLGDFRARTEGISSSTPTRRARLRSADDSVGPGRVNNGEERVRRVLGGCGDRHRSSPHRYDAGPCGRRTARQPGDRGSIVVRIPGRNYVSLDAVWLISEVDAVASASDRIARSSSVSLDGRPGASQLADKIIIFGLWEGPEDGRAVGVEWAMATPGFERGVRHRGRAALAGQARRPRFRLPARPTGVGGGARRRPRCY
jgi:hypothetical protein